MANLFEAVDPRGFTVICTVDQFNNHILQRHPDMNPQDIQLAIEEPELGFIYQDAQRSDRNIYYRKVLNRRLYIKVIVKIENNTANVITAFYTGNVKSGEKWIWPLS